MSDDSASDYIDDPHEQAAYSYARFLMLADLSANDVVRNRVGDITDFAVSLDDMLISLAAVAREGDNRLTPFESELAELERRTAARFSDATVANKVRRRIAQRVYGQS